MITRHTYGSLEWIDVETPTKEEVRTLVKEFSLHPATGEEILEPSHKARVDSFEGYLYLVLHFPALKHTHQWGDEQEVDFIIGKRFIITTRYETIDPLHKFSKIFEVGSILDKSDIGEHAGYIFFYMLRKLYKAINHEMESLREDLEDAEERIFKGQEKDMVFTLSQIGRNLLNIRQALAPHQEVLTSFEEVSGALFGKKFIPEAQKLEEHYQRLITSANTHSEWIVELRDTNQALLFTKQNEIMKTLTIMAFVTFPLTLITSIFGMNTTYLPLIGREGDFWMIIGSMLVLTLTFFVYFRYKRWL